ncbi:MAG: hypothetical protein MJ229_01215 [bacterium]|nr:hypothetical protein [bacterium]
MKKFFYILISLIIFNANIAQAEVTVDEITSERYVRNHGYSAETYRLMNLQHAQIAGTEADVVPQPNRNRKFSLIRKFFIYIDPALDDGKFGEHSVDFSN